MTCWRKAIPLTTFNVPTSSHPNTATRLPGKP